MAWQLLSDFGDTEEIAEDRLNPHQIGRHTRAVAAGKVLSENRFSSFVSKSTILFNDNNMYKMLHSQKISHIISRPRRPVKKNVPLALLCSSYMMLASFCRRNIFISKPING
jgi:hypothetical protein